jgi:SAM-dependent methyltransferase
MGGRVREASGDDADALIGEMQLYYARRADNYDASMGYDDPTVISALEPVADVLRAEMRDRAVLELACGPGFWTQRVAETARSIVASDYSDTVLDMARAKSMESSRVRFVRVDAYSLANIGETFDGAFAVDFLAHVPLSRLQNFLGGLHRQLVPGARVAFCDQTPWHGSLTDMRDGEGSHLQQRALSDGSSYRVIKHFFSDDEFQDLFAAHCSRLDIRRFPNQRRVIVSYSLGI